MPNLSFIELETLRRLFGMKDGFLFKFWTDNKTYNKNKTQEIILSSCNINIYKDPEFKELSQQKCVEKIWNERDPKTVANLIESLCDYYSFAMGCSYWSNEDQIDFEQTKAIVEKLRSDKNIQIPLSEDTPDIRTLIDDIESNIRENKPELALDRLHTYTTQYLRKACESHSLEVVDEKGNYRPIDSLIATLRKYYEMRKSCESEFSLYAMKISTSLFAKFNDIRNNHSYSHPNPVLKKNEAEYVISTMLATLKFIDYVEKDSFFDI